MAPNDRFLRKMVQLAISKLESSNTHNIFTLSNSCRHNSTLELRAMVTSDLDLMRIMIAPNRHTHQRGNIDKKYYLRLLQEWRTPNIFVLHVKQLTRKRRSRWVPLRPSRFHPEIWCNDNFNTVFPRTTVDWSHQKGPSPKIALFQIQTTWDKSYSRSRWIAVCLDVNTSISTLVSNLMSCRIFQLLVGSHHISKYTGQTRKRNIN